MKYKMLFVAVILSLATFAQTSVVLKNNKKIEGNNLLVEPYNNYFVVTQEKGSVNVINYDSIQFLEVYYLSSSIIDTAATEKKETADGNVVLVSKSTGTPLVYRLKSNFKSIYVTSDTDFEELKYQLKHQRKELSKAAGWGIASGSFIVAGTITGLTASFIVNSTSNNAHSEQKKLNTGKALSAVGGIISGIGAVLLIPTFITLKSSSKELKFKYW